MRKVVVLLALVVSTTLFAQTQKGIEKVYNDGKESVKTLYGDVKSLAPELKEGLASIAEGLKTTSEKAWDILVLQQQVWSWCFLFVTLSAIFLWWKFFKQYKLTSTDLTETGEIKTSNKILSFLLICLALVDSIIAGLHFEQMVTGFINPEFGALRTIIEFAINVQK